jgi:hypothetical protein
MIGCSGSPDERHHHQEKDEQKNNHTGRQATDRSAPFSRRASGSFVFTADGLRDRIYACGDAALVIVPPESWGDFVVEDAPGQSVWQRALETVTDLNAHFMIPDEYEENGAVVFSLLTNSPRLRRAHRKIFQRGTGWQFREDRDKNLAGRRTLKVGERFVQRVCSLRTDDSRVIIEMTDWLRGQRGSGVQKVY